MMQTSQPLTVPQLFRGVTAEQFADWSARWVPVTFPAETILCKPHQKGQVLYLVQRGRVSFYYLRHGEKHIIRTVGAGAIFGRMPLMGQLFPDCFVATAAETEVLILSRAAVEQLIRQQPEIALRILSNMGPNLIERELIEGQ